MLRAFVIGCGRIAGIAEHPSDPPNTHAGAYHATSGVELAACFDIDKSRASDFSKQHGCQVAKGFLGGLRDFRPDIVSICTPDHTHYELAREVLLSDHVPRIIFLEKPACQTENQLNQLTGLASDKAVGIVVNHTRRFDLHHLELRTRILRGDFGALYRADATYYSGWQHNGVHVVDTLSFLFDDRLVVRAISNALWSPYTGDPTLELELRFERTPGKVYVSAMDEKLYQLFEFDLKFEKARLRIEDFGNRVRLERKSINNIGEHILEPDVLALPAKTRTPMQVAIGLCVEAIQSGDSGLLDGYRLQDVAATMETLWEGISAYENQSRPA